MKAKPCVFLAVMVHAVSDSFHDVISLMQLNGEWKIAQVLWDRN